MLEVASMVTQRWCCGEAGSHLLADLLVLGEREELVHVCSSPESRLTLTGTYSRLLAHPPSPSATTSYCGKCRK